MKLRTLGIGFIATLCLGQSASADPLNCKIGGTLSAVVDSASMGAGSLDSEASSRAFAFETRAIVPSDESEIIIGLRDVILEAIAKENLTPRFPDESFKGPDLDSLGAELTRFTYATEPMLSLRYQKMTDTIWPQLDCDAGKIVVEPTGWTENRSSRSLAGERKSTDLAKAGVAERVFGVSLGNGKMVYSGKLSVRVQCD